MTDEGVRYERNPDFIFRRIVDEMVLVPVRQNVAEMDCIYTMNEVGALIWERLDGGATLGELRAAIVEVYAVEPEAAGEDVLEFLGELESVGAVRKA